MYKRINKNIVIFSSISEFRIIIYDNNNNIDFISGQYPNVAKEAVFTLMKYIGIQNKTTDLFSAHPY